jgi:hypothetical protein
MTRDEAERERERMAEEHPEATWIVTEGEQGWQLVRIGIASESGDVTPTTEAKPKPPGPDDPRTAFGRNNPYLAG